MTVTELKALITESVERQRTGATSAELRMATRAAKDALRHAVVGQDVERLTDALMDKAQEIARVGRMKDYAQARRRLAVARASIWTPNDTQEAIQSAAIALAGALSRLPMRSRSLV